MFTIEITAITVVCISYRQQSQLVGWCYGVVRIGTHSISYPEVVKGVPIQGLVCCVSYGSFLCFSFVCLVYVVLCFLVSGCQYQCSQLPGKTHLQNDLLCVEWDAKPYLVTRTQIINVVLAVFTVDGVETLYVFVVSMAWPVILTVY